MVLHAWSEAENDPRPQTSHHLLGEGLHGNNDTIWTGVVGTDSALPTQSISVACDSRTVALAISCRAGRSRY